MPVEAGKWLAGVDGCKGGWIRVAYPEGAPDKAEMAIFHDFASLVADDCGRGIIAIDTPIGLPAIGRPGGRSAEHHARAYLGPRRNSVFGIPSRAAVAAYAEGYARVCAIARLTSFPQRAPSLQAFHIFPRILELDAALRADALLASRVFEVHPELSFRAMNGAPLLNPKKRNGSPFGPGMAQRRELLLAQGYHAEFLDHPPRGKARCDDFFDACAAAWSAARIAAGTALCLPIEPEFDEFGLPMRICG